MGTFYFYILRCRDNSLYCGQTTDIESRVLEHNDNQKKASKYVWARRPATLVHLESYPTKSEALRREYAVKQWPKARKESLVMKT
ncbi:MAG: GIY-YIG nuclease family protein [Candidatus Roizmanbacteria bacterium]|nr:GIY-YIG nuclease family protein [Candidatus Roizmanbacteria bacterium]